MIKKLIRRLSYPQCLALGFLMIIFCGALLLCLPFSSKSGEWTSFVDTLFTATSSTCVTGLIVFDTYSQWTIFGQIVILLLIQIGGLGFMAVITMFSVFARKKISLRERSMLVQTSGNMRYNGVVVLIKRIFKGTFIIEGIGALLLFIRFCQQMPFGQALYYSVFHSVSAFCNAGFDLFGKDAPFGSLIGYVNDWYVCLIICVLIIVGGIGFFVWNDIIKHKLDFKKYELHSKLVIVMTAVLVFGGLFAFLFTEREGVLKNMPFGEKIVAALFQSVTTRTAGFCTVDQDSLSESGRLITMVLMFIGGSPASTAGGVKTTTVLVVLLSALSSAKNLRGTTVFKKRIDERLVAQASSVIIIYMVAVIFSAILISSVEPFSLSAILFEIVSAVGTVGVTLGITPLLTAFSKIIIILLMYFGRIGGLSMVLVLMERRAPETAKRPVEKILIG